MVVVGAGARSVAHVLEVEDAQVLVRAHAVGHRPHHHVEVLRVDVLVDRDGDLADGGRVGRCAV